ncbi:g3417 [Coccomyxa viridis]|uniref:G3417 protein n=1 Tax=Coccomyxa viridis TaxID=1274662 RepID=A0ABP1FMR9_9CHLO
MQGADSDYHTIVVGIGAHGSAALYQIAKRGYKVLGLEQFSEVAHDRGSSHGSSRIIRLQYHEHPDYVPLLHRAYKLWRDLEADSGKTVLHITGCLEFSDPVRTVSNCFGHALRSAIEHNLEHEVLTGEEVNKRFPGWRLPSHFKALYQPQGGILNSEEGIRAHTRAAQKHGAILHTGERVQRWQVLPSGKVEVITNKATYTAGRLVLTAGAWMPSPELVPELRGITQVQRQVIGWFEVADKAAFSMEKFPVFIFDDDQLGEYYGFPEFDNLPGMKIGKFYHLNEAALPDQLSRDITSADEEVLRDGISRYLPEANGRMLKAVACMFTNSPDSRFIIDKHPLHHQVVLCSACSGHGYKFASVVGEILADLATSGTTQHDIALHRITEDRKGMDGLLGRFARNPKARL